MDTNKSYYTTFLNAVKWGDCQLIEFDFEKYHNNKTYQKLLLNQPGLKKNDEIINRMMDFEKVQIEFEEYGYKYYWYMTNLKKEDIPIRYELFPELIYIYHPEFEKVFLLDNSNENWNTHLIHVIDENWIECNKDKIIILDK